VNVRYLTGLASSNAALLIPADGDPVLATDSRYAPIAQRGCPDLELVTDRNTAPALIAVAAARGLAPVAVEEHHLTVEQYRELAGERELTAAGRLVEELRTVKDEDEIALLRRACEITDEALAAALAQVRPGLTERQLALALEREMTDRARTSSSTRSWPAGRTGHPASLARRPPAGGRRPDHDRLRGPVRRLPRRPDQDRRARPAAAWQRDLRAGGRGAAGRDPGRGGRRGRGRGGRGGQGRDRRGRARRALRPRPRARRGPGDPRGADAEHRGDR
jgi:hypothetical protein